MKYLLPLALVTFLAIPPAHAGYTFSAPVQSTPSAKMAYNPTTGVFAYSDTAKTSDDNSYVTLTGTPATVVTTTNGWTAKLSVNLTGRSMTSTGVQTPSDGIILGLIYKVGTSYYRVGVSLAQYNNSGNTDNEDHPPLVYGSAAIFFGSKLTDTSEVPLVTVPQNGNPTYNGSSYKPLTGGTSTVAKTVSVDAATGVITLNYNAVTRLLTGSYNGVVIGGYTLPTGSPALTLAVLGFSGEGINISATSATATEFAITGLKSQTITFPEITAKTFGTEPFDLNATASSGLPVSYHIVTNPVTISGSKVTLGGTVTIEATQAGNNVYAPAQGVTRSFTVQ